MLVVEGAPRGQDSSIDLQLGCTTNGADRLTGSRIEYGYSLMVTGDPFAIDKERNRDSRAEVPRGRILRPI